MSPAGHLPHGGTTSISGIVYAPNGIDPLPNVLVYIPSAPVGFDDYEIRATANTGHPPSPVFPSECAAGFLSPEEKVFEYALIELTPNAPALLSPLTYDFGASPVGVATAPQTFTWTNSSVFPATATPSIAGNDFQIVSTDCAVVPGSGSCHVAVIFRPTGLRLLTGSVVVTSTGLLGTQQAMVQGTGTQDLTYSTNYLQFGTHPVGTQTTLPLTVTNIAPFPASLQPLAVTGDFIASAGTCGSAVPANGSCTLQVTFQPTQAGERVGTLTAPANEPVNLEGMGGDYSLTLSPQSGEVEAGKLLAFTATLAPVGAFAGSVSLTCTASAPATTCSLPATVPRRRQHRQQRRSTNHLEIYSPRLRLCHAKPVERALDASVSRRLPALPAESPETSGVPASSLMVRHLPRSSRRIAHRMLRKIPRPEPFLHATRHLRSHSFGRSRRPDSQSH